VRRRSETRFVDEVGEMNEADWWCEGMKKRAPTMMMTPDQVPPHRDVVEDGHQPDAEGVEQPCAKRITA